MSKDEKNRLVPKLRFPEFDTEWTEKFVEDYFDVGSSKRVLEQDWTNRGVPFYRTRELVSLSKDEPFGNEIFISEELFHELSNKYGVPTEGDFLISGVGTLGISYQVRAEDRFYFKDGNVLWFKLKPGINSTYFRYCFQSDFIQNQILAQTSKSTVGTYTIQNAKKTKFWYPLNFKEQQKIADCLSSLDDLITAESGKLEALKAHKKGLMQQLFPAEGETVPKLRFAEFKDSGEWIEATLGSVAIFINGRAYKQEELLDNGKYRVLRVGNFFTNNHWYYSDLELEADKYCEDGDLLYAWSASFGPRIWSGEKIIYHYHIWKVVEKEGINKNFLRILLDYESEKMKAESANGFALLHITKNTIENWKCEIPKTEEEQEKIASCVASLEELITVQSKNVEQLKRHKIGLMQGLFPQLDNIIK